MRGSDESSGARGTTKLGKRWITVGVVILIIVLVPLATYGVYFLLQPTTFTVIGIVDHKSESRGIDETGQSVTLYIVSLKLVTDDSVNGLKAGATLGYIVSKDIYDEVNTGDLVKGTPQKELTLKVVQVIYDFSAPPEVEPSYRVEFNSMSLFAPYANYCGYPYLYFDLINLGDRPIIDVRVELNGTFIPFDSGISSYSPIYAGLTQRIWMPTKWYDPDSNRTVGFGPIDGQSYPVDVSMAFSDGVIIRRSFYVQANSVIGEPFSIDTPEIKAISLLRSENGNILSISIRNTWFNVNASIGTSLFKTISDVAILIDGRPVMKVSTYIPSGYWAISATLPFEISVDKWYNITIQAMASDGSTFTVTRQVKAAFLSL